jgi:hypothetical protein
MKVQALLNQLKNNFDEVNNNTRIEITKVTKPKEYKSFLNIDKVNQSYYSKKKVKDWYFNHYRNELIIELEV